MFRSRLWKFSMMEILNCRINEPLKMKKLLKKIFVSLVVYPFLYIHDSWPIWFYVLNRQGKKAYRQNPPANGLLEKRIVADLAVEFADANKLKDSYDFVKYGNPEILQKYPIMTAPGIVIEGKLEFSVVPSKEELKKKLGLSA